MREVDSRLQDASFMSDTHAEYLEGLSTYFNSSFGSTLEKLENFSKYVPRSTIARFLTKYEMFKKVLNVQGSIIECGVFLGGGLMTWAQLSAILEPANHQRRIIGFDTFTGFPDISKEDKSEQTSTIARKGSMKSAAYDDIQKGIDIYDMTRYLNHIPKVELVEGDISKTAEQYFVSNPHLVVSLLYLDLDLFKPTKKAIEMFRPVIPKGGIIAFDQINSPLWPGETLAAIEGLGIDKLKLERFQFGTGISYAVVGE